MDKLEMYQHMYAILCGAASEAVEDIDREEYDRAREKLINGLESAEDFFVEQSDELYHGQRFTREERRAHWAMLDETLREIEEWE